MKGKVGVMVGKVKSVGSERTVKSGRGTGVGQVGTGAGQVGTGAGQVGTGNNNIVSGDNKGDSTPPTSPKEAWGQRDRELSNTGKENEIEKEKLKQEDSVLQLAKWDSNQSQPTDSNYNKGNNNKNMVVGKISTAASCQSSAHLASHRFVQNRNFHHSSPGRCVDFQRSSLTSEGFGDQ